MRYGRALPVGKFFAYSSALLAVLCVVLIGKGVSALQEAGWLPISPLAGFVRVEIVGLYPTVQGLSAQVAMAALLLIGFWNNRTISVSLRRSAGIYRAEAAQWFAIRKCQSTLLVAVLLFRNAAPVKARASAEDTFVLDPLAATGCTIS